MVMTGFLARAALAGLGVAALSACSGDVEPEAKGEVPQARVSEDQPSAGADEELDEFLEMMNALEAERRAEAVPEGPPTSEGASPESIPVDLSGELPPPPSAAAPVSSRQPAAPPDETPARPVPPSRDVPARSSPSRQLWQAYFAGNSAVGAKLITYAVSSPIFASCAGQPYECHVSRCRQYAGDLGRLSERSGMDAVMAEVREAPAGPKLTLSCALAFTTNATHVPDVVGPKPIWRRNDNYDNAMFMFSIASGVHPDRAEVLRSAFEFSAFTSTGLEQIRQAEDWLAAYGHEIGRSSPDFARAERMMETVRDFWAVWDVTERLGVNMGDPVILNRDFHLERTFRSGGRTFTADDVVDRYYEMNNAGWRNGNSYAEAYWGNGFYAQAYTTDGPEFVLIRVDRRTYEVTVDFVMESEIDFGNANVRAILDYGQNGNAHGYNWDAEGLRTFLKTRSQPFHEWYDLTIPSAEFYAKPQRERINIMRARQGMGPLPKNWSVK